MSGSGKEWIFVAVFFAIYLAVTLGEIYLLTRKGVAVRRAMIFVFSSNFVTISLGFTISFFIFALLLAATSNDGSQAAGGLTGVRSAFLAALAFPVLLMAATRRLLISTLRLEQLGKPLPYSIASTLVFFAALGIPVLFLFLS